MIVNEFTHELELLTQQQITQQSTELGVLLAVNEILTIHFVLLSHLKTNLDLPTWKKANKLEHTVTIFEGEWTNKKAHVLSRIKAKLGLLNRIYARKTSIKKIDRLAAFEFLQANHINTPLKAKYNFALVYQNEVVALAAFGPIMHKKTEGKGDMSGELIRFCSKLDYTVVGGLSKLLKHFTTQYQVDDVMTYIDRDWSDGKGFEKLGFKCVGENNSFAHYFDVENQQFIQEESKNNKTLTICKSGLLKLLFKVKN